MSDQTPTPDWAHITITNERVVLSGGEDLGPASPPLKVSHSCEALPEGEYLLVSADNPLFGFDGNHEALVHAMEWGMYPIYPKDGDDE